LVPFSFFILLWLDHGYGVRKNQIGFFFFRDLLKSKRDSR
jgi:hypothetical protein